MDPQELRSKLRGVIGFPVTPFRPDLSLDAAGLRKNVRFMLSKPLAAVVAAGGTGELYSLTPAEHAEVVAGVVEEARGKAPVIAAVGFNRPIAVEMARQAARAGAAGILALPPYYPNADDEGLLDYYRAIGEATPLGMIVYSRDGVHPAPAWVERAAAALRTLVAWKEGQADIRRYQMIIERLGDRLHWIGGAGDDMVPAYYALGIRTFTSSIANVSPALALRLHELASAGDRETLPRLMHDYVIPLYAFRGRRRGYEVSVMKAMLDQMGLAGGPVRPPLPNLRPDELGEVKAMLEKWKPVL